MKLQEKNINKEELLERSKGYLEKYGNLSVYYNPDNVTDVVRLDFDGKFINHNDKSIKVRRVSIGEFCKLLENNMNNKRQLKVF